MTIPTTKPMILGIETSGRSGTIAFSRDDQILLETELSATGRRHARTLVPEIGNALQTLALTTKDLTAVAVIIGPGSFTGLRVGIVCAKTLAFSLKIPLVAVDTFAAIAKDCPAQWKDLWVIDDALRGDVYAGHYKQVDDGQWETVTRPELISIPELAKTVAPEAYVIGPCVTKLRDQLTEAGILNTAHRNPEASQIARIGESMFLAGNVDDVWSVEPHYIRRSAAEEKADVKE